MEGMADPGATKKYANSKSQSTQKRLVSSAEKDWQKNVLCRFFKNGMCNKGDECVYSHDRSLSNRGTLPCKYFLTGTCAYGDECRFSHDRPYSSDTNVSEEDNEKNHLPLQFDSSQQFNLEVPSVTPVYPALLNQPSDGHGFINESPIIHQYDINYEPSIEFSNFLPDDSYPTQHILTEMNSFYNENPTEEDSGVDDLTYPFNTSLTLDQVPSIPDAPIATTPTPTGGIWAANGSYRSTTPAITSSPYSPPPFSDTSWAEAPEFVPRTVKSPSVTINSHNASNQHSRAFVLSSTKTNQERFHAGSSSHAGQQQPNLGLNPDIGFSNEKPYNMQQMTSLIPSNTMSIDFGYAYGAKSNISDTKNLLPCSNMGYSNYIQPLNNVSGLEQYSSMNNTNQDLPHNMDRHQHNTFRQFTQKNAMEKKNIHPPPPPPPPQDDNGMSNDDTESIPKTKTWAQVVNGSSNNATNFKPESFKTIEKAVIPTSIADAESQLCPFSLVGECRYGEHCAYVHGLVCDLCGTPSLHPNHEKQRRRHQEECMNQHEIDMEHAFAVAKSKDKTCGICMEVVMDKSKGEARFGIMPNCNHCYCLSCLRKWRQAKQFEHKIIRACPECRQTSDYICPSRYWVETKEEKEQLLTNYKIELKKKECKYFDKGNGECPFGNKCFYRHEDKSGKIVDVGPPSAQTMNRPRMTRGAPYADDVGDSDGVDIMMTRHLLFDFLEARDGRVTIQQLDEFLDILDFLSDTEDSDNLSELGAS